MHTWWHCWAAMPLFVYQIFLLSFLIFDVQMVALLGCNATICVSNIFTVFLKRLETFTFLILILCLLDWLDFWAEVHLVQEVNCECSAFLKKIIKNILDNITFLSFF